MDLSPTAVNEQSYYGFLCGIEASHIWIDEANEISERCRNVLLSLLRLKVPNLNIKRKILLTCNPDRDSFL